jgi:hypothetical protein
MRIGIEPVHAHSIATGFDVAPTVNLRSVRSFGLRFGSLMVAITSSSISGEPPESESGALPIAPSTNGHHSNVDMSYVSVWHTQIGVMGKISTVELFGNLSR